MRTLRALLVSCLTLSALPASAQVVVTDIAVTTRNAALAALQDRLARLQEEQHSRLRRMAQRLSLFTTLAKYRVPDAPRWRIHDFENPDLFLYARPYLAALNYGDARAAFDIVAQPRTSHIDLDAIGRISPAARRFLEHWLATLDLADSTIILNTHQTGQLRYNGRRELQAIEALEQHVIDPSNEQSATAVTDKISGAHLIAARQRQARLQFLLALTEQSLVEAKRTRDVDVLAMNTQLAVLRDAAHLDRAFIAGTGDALNQWRQP